MGPGIRVDTAKTRAGEIMAGGGAPQLRATATSEPRPRSPPPSSRPPRRPPAEARRPRSRPAEEPAALPEELASVAEGPPGAMSAQDEALAVAWSSAMSSPRIENRGLLAGASRASALLVPAATATRRPGRHRRHDGSPTSTRAAPSNPMWPISVGDAPLQRRRRHPRPRSCTGATAPPPARCASPTSTRQSGRSHRRAGPVNVDGTLSLPAPTTATTTRSSDKLDASLHRGDLVEIDINPTRKLGARLRSRTSTAPSSSAANDGFGRRDGALEERRTAGADLATDINDAPDWRLAPGAA